MRVNVGVRAHRKNPFSPFSWRAIHSLNFISELGDFVLFNTTINKVTKFSNFINDGGCEQYIIYFNRILGLFSS